MRIVYFDIDSLRPDHLGCYGYARPTSPTIDAVARQGMRFDCCYTSDSPCQPSRSALSTGRFGYHNGIVTHGPRHNHLRIRERAYGGPQADNQLLQLRLRDAGYDTFLFSTFPIRHSATWFGLGWTGNFSPRHTRCGNETAEVIVDAALDWMRANPRRDAWFCHINVWDPHRVYRVDPSWADRFKGVPVPQDWPDDDVLAEHGTYDGHFTAMHQFENHRSWSPLAPGAVRCRADFEHLVTGYDASIAHVDHHIQRVLDELDRQGVLDETAIIISADHGDAFGEHGIYSDHVSAHEPIHHIPLIVKWPGVTKAGASCDEMVYQLDLSATLIDLLGLEAPPAYDGASLAGHLRGKPAFRRDHLVWGHGLYTLQRGVRTRDHLLLRTYDDFGYRQFKPTMLYDMAADPFMTRDLAEQNPRKTAELNGLLDAWLDEQARKPHAGPDPLLEVDKARRAAAVSQRA